MSYVIKARPAVAGLASYYAVMGLGAIGCVGEAIWADWKAGGARGNAAAKAIQANLNEIGYGPLVVNGDFSGGSLSSWGRFARANGVADKWPDRVGILKLCEQAAKGGNQGGSGVVETHVVGGEYVPGKAPGGENKVAQAGLGTGTLIGIGVAGVVILGGLALLAKKKQGGPLRTAAHDAQRDRP